MGIQVGLSPLFSLSMRTDRSEVSTSAFSSTLEFTGLSGRGPSQSSSGRLSSESLLLCGYGIRFGEGGDGLVTCCVGGDCTVNETRRRSMSSWKIGMLTARATAKLRGLTYFLTTVSRL